MVKQMDASIVVCTYKRAESLKDTLAALKALQAPAGLNWEVLVVDNNSPDHTRAVVEAAQSDWPRLRYTFESAQGLSHARNRGIAETSGEVILFTDDDVLPEPDWLEVSLAGLERYGADACGGFIAPLWETPPPTWLSPRFHGFLAVRTDRSDDYPIDTPALAPYGANMVVKKTVFDQIGGFDTSRGRSGKSLASGEDGELFERILRAGFKAVFLGRSRVHHKVEAFRCTKAYMRRWRFQTSRNIAISKGVEGLNRFFNIPLYMFVQLLRALGRVLVGKVTCPADEAFYREIIVSHFLGTMHGLYIARAKRP